MTEQWRPIEGWGNRYEVSDEGRVRSIGTGRLLALNVAKRDGRHYVHLYDKPKRRRIAVHRLVLEAFAGPAPEGAEGCHNDGDKTNNRASNLRWDTHSGNGLDSVRHGTHPNARKTHCPQGHPYSGGNLGEYTRPNGWKTRYCRICVAARGRVRSQSSVRATENLDAG